MKRVLIITQYFYPENFRINELASSLVDKGYLIDALVGIPNYPDGVYYKRYGIFRKRVECHNGVNIYRCFQFPRKFLLGNIGLILNYSSFVVSACLWVLFFFSWKKKYNAIIAFEPSPITQILPAILLGKIRNIKVLSWIQDIFPDSIVGHVTNVQGKILIPTLEYLTNLVYRNSSMILISSKGMEKLICRYGDYSNKIEYLPNWSDDFGFNIKPADVEVPAGFNIMMAGSINVGIGISDLVHLFVELSDIEDVNILVVGSGSCENELRNYIEKNHLKNVKILGRFSYNTMGGVYAHADALLITLLKTDMEHLDVTVPSRLQAYMSAGKPVFAMIGSGAANVINEADCGFVASAGDYKKLAQLIRDNYNNTELLKQKGENARKAFLREFTLEKGVEHFEKLINE